MGADSQGKFSGWETILAFYFISFSSQVNFHLVVAGLRLPIGELLRVAIIKTWHGMLR